MSMLISRVSDQLSMDYQWKTGATVGCGRIRTHQVGDKIIEPDKPILQKTHTHQLGSKAFPLDVGVDL